MVRGASAVQVAFADRRRAGGKVMATDATTDIALVRAERTGLPPATFQTPAADGGGAYGGDRQPTAVDGKRTPNTGGLPVRAASP